MHTFVGRIALAFAAVSVLGGEFSVAQAQSPANPEATGEASDFLEEVIVTAERRSSDIQRTATSVSVRTGQELEQQGRYTLTDILRDVPGVVGGEPILTANGGSETQGGGIIIRGVTSGLAGGAPGGTITGSATTAVYVDGVYEGLGRNYDIQRVEVLRGPQGTLYGRSATSGVVATYTRDPTFDGVTGFGTAQFSNYARRLFTGAVNVPLGNSLAIRASVSKSQADRGYYDGDGGAFDFVGGRIKALYQATDDLSLLFGFAFEENDQNTGGCSATSPVDGVIVYDNCLAVNSTHNHGRQYWLDMKWNLGPVSLYYQPALRKYYQTSVSAVVGPKNLPMQQSIRTPYDQFITQELRLASNSDGKFTWQAGLFYYWNNIRSENVNRWASSGALLFDSPTSRDTKDYGVFGEGTYAFTDATRLTVGARYDYTRVDTAQLYTANLNAFCQTSPLIPPVGGPACPPQPSPLGIGLPEFNVPTPVNSNTNPSGLSSWRKANYKVRIEHDLTPQNMLYGVVSTGFIPGDVSVSSGAVTRFDAETLTAFEIGSKNRFLDNRLQLNGDVFYYRYGGFQQNVIPDPNNPFASYITTVPARLQGVELEGLYQLTPNDRLALNYAYVNCRYVDKPAQFAADIPWKTCALTTTNGTAPQISAPSTINASYEHVFNLPGGSSLLARIDGNWHSSYRYFNPTNTALALPNIGSGVLRYAYLSSGTLGNVNVNWSAPGDKYSMGVYVRNFTDERWITYDVRSLNPRQINARQSDPRTYGVVLSAKF